jgi:hypothetical protein
MADLFELGDVFENRSTVTGKGPLETVYDQIPAQAATQDVMQPTATTTTGHAETP